MAQTKTSTKKAASKQATRKTTTKKTASRKTAKKKVAKSAKAATGEKEVTIDRRRSEDRRIEAESSAPAPAPKLERREKVNRRRQIDPTTCERDYSDHEVEFMNALDNYKRKSGRMFPTCSEVLEVIREIGYVRLSATELAELRLSRGEHEQPTDTIEDQAAAEATEALEESEALRVE